MTSQLSPFGTYSLSPWRESVRQIAATAPASKPGMWAVSLLRKASLLGHSSGMNGPLDINVADGVNARLFPNTNRCEKRAFAGVQIWDPRERACLDEAVQKHTANRPFVFLDVGANIGLYSLFVNASAKHHGKQTKIIAVEPDKENRARLSFNMDASGCDATIEPIGIADEEGHGVLTKAGANRGGISILDAVDDAGGNGTSIPLETLPALISRHKLERVDAMKIDIEGRDEAALRCLVATAPEAVWPRIIVVETGRDTTSPITNMLIDKGYRLHERTGINAIMKYDGTKSDKSTGGNK